MALNKFMHPRNLYRSKKPDFVSLALKYPEFKELSSQGFNGKVTLDFKNPESVRILTQTLLKEDFNLDIEIPNDRLVPTLSSRLNYIHWIEDMFSDQYDGLNGVDIGTGSSCIYAILGCKLNNWSFLATEIDEKNFQYACQNVSRNNMEEKIKVIKVKENSGIPETIIKDSNKKFDFSMCNPPFFADHMEAQAISTSRKADRPEPPSLNTAEDCESIIHGGEAAFIKDMIKDSFKLKDKIRIFTSMVGKKINVAVIKDELKRQQIKNCSTTEFCQGKTMRWGVAWSFDETVKFPKSYFEKKKKTIITPLVYEIPFDNGVVLYDIQNITAFIVTQLQLLKVSYKEGKRSEKGSTITMTAKENTWSHQRRKRRQEQFENNSTPPSTVDKNSVDNPEKSIQTSEKPVQDSEKSVELDVSSAISAEKSQEVEPQNKKMKSDQDQNENNNNNKKTELSKSLIKLSSETVVQKGDKSGSNPSATPKELEETKGITTKKEESSSSEGKKNYRHILKCRLVLRKKDDFIELEVIDLDKTNRDLANQILQYFKNKLRSKT